MAGVPPRQVGWGRVMAAHLEPVKKRMHLHSSALRLGVSSSPSPAGDAVSRCPLPCEERHCWPAQVWQAVAQIFVFLYDYYGHEQLSRTEEGLA